MQDLIGNYDYNIIYLQKINENIFKKVIKK